jgi:hypothetical protein
MWLVDGKVMRPLLDQAHLDVAWHAGQYQALPEIYVQNSALEIAWTRVISQTGTREGRVVAPFFTKGHEGFNVDDEEDWARARALVGAGTRRSRRSSGHRTAPRVTETDERLRRAAPRILSCARKTRPGTRAGLY